MIPFKTFEEVENHVDKTLGHSNLSTDVLCDEYNRNRPPSLQVDYDDYNFIHIAKVIYNETVSNLKNKTEYENVKLANLMYASLAKTYERLANEPNYELSYYDQAVEYLTKDIDDFFYNVPKIKRNRSIRNKFGS